VRPKTNTLIRKSIIVQFSLICCPHVIMQAAVGP